MFKPGGEKKMNLDVTTCPCCGYKSLPEDSTFDICPICHWEDDPTQSRDLDFGGGANNLSLRQAQYNFKKFGTADFRSLDFIRNLTETDEKDPHWKEPPDYGRIYNLTEEEEMLGIVKEKEVKERIEAISEKGKMFKDPRKAQAISPETGKPIEGSFMIIATRVAYPGVNGKNRYIAALEKYKNRQSKK